MTLPEISKLLARIAITWPSCEIAKADKQTMALTAQIWMENTEDIEYWAGVRAVSNLAKSNKFPPSIAEFCTAAKDEVNTLKITEKWHYDMFRAIGENEYRDLFKLTASAEIPLMKQAENFLEYWQMRLLRFRSFAGKQQKRLPE